MLKFIFILTGLFLTSSASYGQHPDSEDYKLYSTLIKSEISGTAKSVTIIKNLEHDTISISWVINAIKSKDARELAHLRFLTRDAKGHGVGPIDTATQNLILNFYQHQAEGTILTNSFKLNTKIFLTASSPFKKHSKNAWEKFFKKYPGSGGLFTFSNIYYSQNNKSAIFYHSHLKDRLNGHGSLTIMERINGQWEITYQTYLWQA